MDTPRSLREIFFFHHEEPRRFFIRTERNNEIYENFEAHAVRMFRLFVGSYSIHGAKPGYSDEKVSVTDTKSSCFVWDVEGKECGGGITLCEVPPASPMRL